MKCDIFRVSFSVVNRLPFTLNTHTYGVALNKCR